jgi:hypothetical protein
MISPSSGALDLPIPYSLASISSSSPVFFSTLLSKLDAHDLTRSTSRQGVRLEQRNPPWARYWRLDEPRNAMCQSIFSSC